MTIGDLKPGDIGVTALGEEFVVISTDSVQSWGLVEVYLYDNLIREALWIYRGAITPLQDWAGPSFEQLDEFPKLNGETLKINGTYKHACHCPIHVLMGGCKCGGI